MHIALIFLFTIGSSCNILSFSKSLPGTSETDASLRRKLSCSCFFPKKICVSNFCYFLVMTFSLLIKNTYILYPLVLHLCSILRLRELGILDQLKRRTLNNALSKCSQDETESQSFSLYHVAFAFFLFLGGISGTCVVWFLEKVASFYVDWRLKQQA